MLQHLEIALHDLADIEQLDGDFAYYPSGVQVQYSVNSYVVNALVHNGDVPHETLSEYRRTQTLPKLLIKDLVKFNGAKRPSDERLELLNVQSKLLADKIVLSAD
jgi:hypothetical protein